MSYNKKIDYQFCKNIVIGSTDENEWRLRRVFNLIEEPICEAEFRLLKCKKLLESLFVSIDLLKSLNNIHQEMYESPLPCAETALIEKLLNSTNDELIYQRLAESCLFDSRVDFLAFVYTAKRIIAQMPPVIFYMDSTKLMYACFRVGNTKVGSAILTKMKKQTDFQNHCHGLVSREEIIGKLLVVQDQLSKQFSIRTLYLYGSCARNEMDEYSDVDLICIVDYEDKQRLAKETLSIYEFFTRILALPVDLKIGGDEDDVVINANIRQDLYKIF